VGKLMVQETFKDPQTGEVLQEGKEYDVPQMVSRKVAEKADSVGKGSYAEELEEPPVLELEEPEEEDQWNQLSKDLDETSQLPKKWNPSRDDPPEPGKTLFGTVKRTGSGPYGKFIVVKEKDTGEKHTVWEQTALENLMEAARADDLVAVRFEGLDTNPRGQKYLNYSIACRSPEGGPRL